MLAPARSLVRERTIVRRGRAGIRCAAPYAYGWYVQEYRGTTLNWHSGWDEEAGFSGLYLKAPEHDLTLILLANGDGLWWGNPLDQAAVHRSPFAQAFLDRFVFGETGRQPAAERTRSAP